MRGRGGAALAAAALVAVLGMVGCGTEPGQRATPSSLVAPDGPTTTAKDQRLTSREYAVGECVTWLERGNYEEQTRTVPCTQAHRIQISGRVTGPAQAAFPTDAQWTAFRQAACAPSVAALLGAPLDPTGRFGYGSLEPTERGWNMGDRVVWCGVQRSAAGTPMLTGDVRGADQRYHFAAGQCVDEPPHAPEPTAVPCDRPHLWEATGEVSYPDGPVPPASEPRCEDLAVRYLGRQPVAPWGVGFYTIKPASWAAGARTTPCFVGQWGPDDRLVEVSTSAKA